MPEDAWSALYSKYGGGKVEVSANSMGLFEKCKKVLLTPSEFFEKIKTERDILEAFKYLVVLSLIPVVAAGISLTSFFYYYRSMVVPGFIPKV
jgi:hypothetical protein